MKIVIEIPEEFKAHWFDDCFEDSLHRLSADAHLLAGSYEQEVAIMLIKAFKSAQPERKRGRWIDKTSGYAFNYECSNCGYTVHYQFIDEYNFCPNCGAKMKGDTNG